MTLFSDPVMIVNLIVCVIILVLGFLVYRKRENIDALLIGIAFGLFGLSHLYTLLGLTMWPEITFVMLRLAGYILVAVALFRMFKE
jgi:Na+/proline symporter